MPGIVGIPQHSNPGGPRDCLFEELELLEAHVHTQGGHARYVPARTRQAGHEAQIDGIGGVHHDDRDRRRRPPGAEDSGGVHRNDHVDLETGKLERKLIESLGFSFGLSNVKRNVLTFDIAELAQDLSERFGEADGQHADPLHPYLLRLGGERRGEERSSHGAEEHPAIQHVTPWRAASSGWDGTASGMNLHQQKGAGLPFLRLPLPLTFAILRLLHQPLQRPPADTGGPSSPGP